ncbi:MULTISPECIES: tyrosine-type recombinase/integrase [Nocardia]|uniref:tyrosine-type recombinase/integrase n=1 Tax=Nocardia TaxID=1817 RepID=UPI0007A38840|nr:MULTISPECIES: site-specific integrase [Nocardia]
MVIRRNRRAGVEDRWYKTITVENADGEKSRQRVRSANYGCRKRWRARYVDDEGQEHSQSFERKPDAQAWLDGVVSSLVTGTHIAPSAGRETIGAAGRRWLDTQGHLKATTDATRRDTWRPHVEPRWGNIEIRNVRTSDVRAWVAQMVADGAGVPTIENAVGILRMILETAVEDRQILRNPCTGVKLPRRQHKQRGYLTHVQVELLARNITEKPTVIRFLAYTGLRWGEMAALKVSNFDMLRRRVNVIEAVAEVKGKLVWSTAKTYERRSVPFPKFLAEELAGLMRGKGRDDLVFTSVEGQVLRVSTYRKRVFNPAVKRIQEAERKRTAGARNLPPGASFPKVTPRDLRHTAASLAISAGANPKAVQLMLGHKSAAMTLDTYADLFPDDLEVVAERLDEAARSAVEAAADELRTGTDGQQIE